MSSVSVRDWTVEYVCRWLSNVNLGHLAIRFESLRVDGQALIRMDEVFVDTKLRLNPAERTTFFGALNVLKSNEAQHYVAATLPSPRITIPTKPKHNTFGNADITRPRFNSDLQLRKVRLESRPLKIPEVLQGPAAELLSNCRHSGWIRKQGGSHRGWRQRYMVLRLGHLYYYERENSLKAKGYFSLKGYSVEQCMETQRGKPWCFKLVPDDPAERTYIVSTAAQHELRKWVEEINEEILSYEDHLYDPVSIDDEDDDRNYEQMDNPTNDDIYDEPEDSGYVKITKSVVSSLPSTGTPTSTFQRSNTDTPLSPKHGVSSTILTTGKRQGSLTPRESPHVPPRSKESLSFSAGSSSNLVEEEDPYLEILGLSGQRSKPLLNPNKASVDSIDSPPYVPRRSIDELNPSSVKEITTQFSNQEIEDEDPYYIRLDKVDDVLPNYCQFGEIGREEAVRKLTMDDKGNVKYTRPGTYLIRGSTQQDVLHVLSVWTGSECKHFKLYYKDGSENGKGYCLTQGKIFPSIPLLLSNYKQEDLPKSPQVTLSEPYHPKDY